MINIRLADNTNYDYSAILSIGYNGEGFYINNRKKVKNLINIYGWDKHWAYGGVLRNNIVPLTSRLGDTETDLAIYCVKYTYKKRKYNCFYYTLYGVKSINNMYFMTHLDYQIFCDLYESDIKIIKKYYFQDIGYLSANMIDLIDKIYIEKQKDKENKTMYEASFYGMFARCLNPDTMREKGHEVHLADLIRYEMAYSCTGCEDVRDERVPLAIWQTAYLRYEEWQAFKKYKNHIIYMNTDSVYTDIDINFEDSKLIGHYHKEYDNLPTLFIRRNSYIVLNSDGKSIYKTKLGGATKESQKQVTIDDVYRLLDNGEEELSLRTNFRNKYGAMVEIPYKVSRNFLLM